MEKEVRFATAEDYDFIYDALCEDLEEQGVRHRFKYSKLEFKDLIFGEKPRAIFLVLWIGGHFAGFTNYSIDYRNCTANLFANLYINDLFVKKPYRRRRGAALLLEKLKEIARQEGCGRIEFIVLKKNKGALEFYEKCLKSKIISDKLHYMRLEIDNDK